MNPAGRLWSIVAGDGRCVGFLLRRRPGEIEAYSWREESLGYFTDEHRAIIAVVEAWKAPPDSGIAPGGVRDRELRALRTRPKSGARQ